MSKELVTQLGKGNPKSLYKKMTLANLLNWFAVHSLRAYSKICARSVGAYSKICACLISYAITLDPSREIFKKNLTDLRLKNTGISKKKKKFKFFALSEVCNQVTEKTIFFYRNKIITLSKPKVFNPNYIVTDNYACTVILPDAYLAVIKDAQVFAGTDLIIVNNLAIYDEIDKGDLNQTAIKSPIISAVIVDEITINMPKIKRYIKKGVHLTKDHSINYFHWVIECLPKLSLVTDLSADIPLLVDDFLPIQFYDALDILNSGRREIIRMKKNNTYIVKKLYYPSRLSIVRDNYGLPIYDKDVIYSAEGVQFVREAILTTINSDVEPNRKIFVSRKNSSYRQLLNSVEIENILIARGFEVIFPENLSFFSQVKIFSQAKIIIGQSGAGMANFIFAPETAKILMMLSDAPGSNLQLFNGLAEAAGIHLEYLMGKTASVLKKYNLHSDFYVDINLLADYLDKEAL
jgi:capsular polysaccharide biosynthesis protein